MVGNLWNPQKSKCGYLLLPKRTDYLHIIFQFYSVFDFRHCCCCCFGWAASRAAPSSDPAELRAQQAWRRLGDAEDVGGEEGEAEGGEEGEVVVVVARSPSTGARKDEKGARQDLRVSGDHGYKLHRSTAAPVCT